MVNAFSHFSLPEISVVARRTALVALVLGTVALVGLVLLGLPLTGLGICLGLLLALVNFRLIARATVRASAARRPEVRRPLVLNTLGRLGAISIVALGLAFVSLPLGVGIFVGLAAFQITLLANVVMAMLHAPPLGSLSAPAPEVDAAEDQ